MGVYLDLNDLAKELDELRGMRDDTHDSGLCKYDAGRLEALEALEGQLFTDSLSEYARNEATLIHEDAFEEYAREYAESVGLTLPWDNPLSRFVDWAGWAESLKEDYTEVTFEGWTYLLRAY